MRNLKFIAVLILLMLARVTLAQTSSQVSGNVNASFNLQIANPLALYTNLLALNQPLITGQALSYGTNGDGVCRANQMYVAQFFITNGALVGTNVLNLNTMAMNGATPNDAVGNAFSLRNVKMLAFQNLGVSGSPSETNVIIVTTNGPATGWTNYWGLPNLVAMLPGPGTNATQTTTATSILWGPGDVGWIVGTAANDSILFTNPVPGTVSVLNFYAVGSTGQ